MFKSILLLNRKRGTTLEEFRQYYEETHAPLAASILNPSKYVRNYSLDNAVPEPYVKANYDCITELGFDAVPQITDKQIGILREDEARFIDLDSMRIVQVDVCETEKGVSKS